jgi:predicted transcriptional regulator
MNATATRSRLTLHAETAADLMVSNPVSIREEASVLDAIVLFTNKGFSAAPVIDAAGRPVGVVGCSDVMIHERTNAQWGSHANERFKFEDSASEGPRARVSGESGMRVSDLMTPAVFSVSLDTAADKVIQEMLALKVHRLFVVDAAGVLVGVISPLDVLRHLRDERRSL